MSLLLLRRRRAAAPGCRPPFRKLVTETDDSLMVLRGRLRDQDQLRRRFGLAVPLLVRFDDYTVDITENRVLRAAAELLLRLPGVDARVRQRLRGIRLMLAECPLGRRSPGRHGVELGVQRLRPARRRHHDRPQ